MSTLNELVTSLSKNGAYVSTAREINNKNSTGKVFQYTVIKKVSDNNDEKEETVHIRVLDIGTAQEKAVFIDTGGKIPDNELNRQASKWFNNNKKPEDNILAFTVQQTFEDDGIDTLSPYAIVKVYKEEEFTLPDDTKENLVVSKNVLVYKDGSEFSYKYMKD